MSSGANDTVARWTFPQSSWINWAVLGVALVSVSASAVLIRFAHEADPLAISLWRCIGGSVALGPFARRGLQRLHGVGWNVPLIAGVFLAVHFAMWITSLQLTTVAASVLLVSTTPIWVGTASWLLFKQKLSPAAWIGIFFTVIGASLIGGGDLSGSNFTGDLLALTGGVAAAGYVLAGRTARRVMGNIEYSFVTYASAGVLILIVCLIAGTQLWGYRASTWWAIAGIVAGPQLLGHTVINYVLKQFEVTTVSAAIMVEPLIATWLAFAFFHEVPTTLIYPAGLAVVVGIYLVSSASREPPEIVE